MKYLPIHAADQKDRSSWWCLRTFHGVIHELHITTATTAELLTASSGNENADVSTTRCVIPGGEISGTYKIRLVVFLLEKCFS